MEYGTEIEKFQLNNNHKKFVGYEQNPELNNFFSNDTIRFISKKTTQLLEGVDPANRHIVVSDDNIIHIMNQVYSSYKPPVGDIYSRLHIISQKNTEDYVPEMIDQVIEIVTSYVRNTVGMEENNRKLTIWTTVYGDFNAHGLRRTSLVKCIREKRPTPFQFHTKY